MLIPFILLTVFLPANFTALVTPMLDSPNETIMAFRYEQNSTGLYVQDQVPIKIIYERYREVAFEYPKGNKLTIHPHHEICQPSVEDLQIMKDNNRNIEGIVCNGTVMFFDRYGATPEVKET